MVKNQIFLNSLWDDRLLPKYASMFVLQVCPSLCFYPLLETNASTHPERHFFTRMWISKFRWPCLLINKLDCRVIRHSTKLFKLDFFATIKTL